MPKLEIVQASESDAPVILNMIQELAKYEKLEHLVTATEEQVRSTLFGAKPAAEVLLARSEEECVGFALFFATYSTFLAQPGIYLEDLYVKPHMRGRGVGRAILKHLAQLAVARDCGRVEWEVLNWNEPSIRFYEKLGATPLNEWTKYRLTGDALTRLGDFSASLEDLPK
jgi:GNAT superfamily N-acetyltransferase